jgi:hypothetical protein
MSGTWVDDGSNSTESDGVTVTCKSVESGTPSNALFKGFELAAGGGQAYWTIKFTEAEEGSGTFVGLTSESAFGQGWALKGYMYGGPGNVSSGGCGLIFGMGEAIKSGDTIGILAEAEADHLRIYYYHNNKALGLAFDLPKEYLSPLLPCISFNGKGKATVNRETVIPTQKDRKDEYDPNSIVGYWGLVSCSLEKGNATFRIKTKPDAPDTYSATLRTVNTTQVELKKVTDKEWSVRTGAMTRMGGPPEEMAFESGLVRLMSQVKSIELDGQLVCRNDPTGDKSVVWERITEVFTPATSLQ